MIEMVFDASNYVPAELDRESDIKGSIAVQAILIEAVA